VRARAGRVAPEIPVATVVTLARIAVEEAVLLARVQVVARDAGRERRLVVVEGTDALRIGRDCKLRRAIFRVTRFESVG